MISSIELPREWLLDNPRPLDDLLDGYERPPDDDSGNIMVSLDESADCFIRNTIRLVIDGPDGPVRHMTTRLMLKVYGPT